MGKTKIIRYGNIFLILTMFFLAGCDSNTNLSERIETREEETITSEIESTEEVLEESTEKVNSDRGDSQSGTTTLQQTTSASTYQETQTATTSAPLADNRTVSQKNAIEKAKSYLRILSFSRDGLITQLEFEGFSYEDAVYGVDNSGADWNSQAIAEAKNYLNTMPFSYQGLVDQLLYEKFTYDQAVYGVTANGL